MMIFKPPACPTCKGVGHVGNCVCETRDEWIGGCCSCCGGAGTIHMPNVADTGDAHQMPKLSIEIGTVKPV